MTNYPDEEPDRTAGMPGPIVLVLLVIVFITGYCCGGGAISKDTADNLCYRLQSVAR